MKEGIRGIFLHGFMSFAAVCVTVACLLIVGSFSCLTYNLNIMVEDLNKTNQVFVVLPDALLEKLANDFTYATWQRHNDTHTLVRFCTSWATKSENVDNLCCILKQLSEN